LLGTPSTDPDVRDYRIRLLPCVTQAIAAGRMARHIWCSSQWNCWNGAALTPRPRINLILYYGVLGARAAWRRRIVPSAATADASVSAGPRARAGGNYLWAELMQRTFGVDVLTGPPG
jgi:hypothetical protein